MPQDLPPVTGAQHYQVQFSTVQEHAQLVERAKALVARERPGVTLGELHLEAMRLLVASLEKRKFAVSERSCTSAKLSRRLRETDRDAHDPGPAARQRGETEPRQYESLSAPRQRGETEPRERSRYVPASERREVYRRDEGRCTYIDARGERCCETRYLELHHLQPFAKNGAHVATNLTLRCETRARLRASWNKVSRPWHQQIAIETEDRSEEVRRERAPARP